MGRPLRIEYPDAFYHITARGNEQQDLFRNNRDRESIKKCFCFNDTGRQ